MARPRSLVSAALCLCVSTILATPVRASPHAGVPFAELAAPGEVVSVPAPGANSPAQAPLPRRHTPREHAPAAGGAGPGLPFAPTGWRWRQPRIRVHTEPVPLEAAAASSVPTAPFLVVRTTSGRPLVLAVTPPGDPLPPPRPRRLSPVAPFAIGLATFALSYLGTWAATAQFQEDCSHGDWTACRRARIMMIPVAGPILVADGTRHPGYYALTAFQGAGLLAAVIGLVAILHRRHRRQVLEARGIRLARHTALRLDGGLAGGQVSLHQRF